MAWRPSPARVRCRHMASKAQAAAGGSTTPTPQPVATNGRAFTGFSEIASFIWSVADLLRGDYKQSEYGKVILPFTVLRRLDCVLEPTKAEGARPSTRSSRAARSRTSSPSSTRIAGVQFYNTSHARPREAPGRPGPHRRQPPRLHRRASPTDARDIFEHFDFDDADRQARRVEPALPVVCEVRRHRPAPRRGRNLEMGYVFEELIRRFAELSNETAGEHFTPREVIRLMVEPAVHRGRRRADASRASCARSRPGLRHRRHAVGRRGAPARAEPRRPAGGVRPGAERRVLRHLQVRHDDQGPGRREHRARQHASARTAMPGEQLRLHARQSAVRRGVEEGRAGRSAGRARDSRASPAASAPACRASTTARSCSCST